MTNPEFCPFCSAMHHKVVLLDENMYFCKECNKFYTLEHKKFRCPKCNSPNLVDSDFPSPDGNMVFHCRGCRKMHSAQDVLKANQ